tara:strand:+ start:2708 stop:3304 length:597 start_codon:yes stop_codon:yes gene_type:complete
MTEMPLFPLSAVLVPHGRMPLRIFEQRYIDLVRDSLRNETSFGMVWIRHGSEVAERGRAAPELGNHGTSARIVDWDQLPDGLLGITIEGQQRFELFAAESRANGLVVGEVTEYAAPQSERMRDEWQPLLDVLRSLETHPHVERMHLDIDYNDAWQVGYNLVQLLPIEETLKYQMLGMDAVEDLMDALDSLLTQVSGEA